MVGIDGWSGSGKTALAEHLAGVTGATVVHLDDLVPGWDGLAESVRLLVERVLTPLATGRPAVWAAWDWTAGRFGPADHRAEPAGLVLVEGCGAGAAPARALLDGLVWLDEGPAERRRRLEGRSDWPSYQPWWQRWAEQEAALRSMDDPRPHADLVVRWAGWEPVAAWG